MALRDELLLKLKIKSSKRGCPWQVMDAIITTESNWDPYAVRYEPNFSYLEDPLKYAKQNSISFNTEKMLQKMSWGLGQVMGGTLRSAGYSGPLTKLCQPELNLEWTCHIFSNFFTKHQRIEEAVASYNAGSPRKDEKGLFVNQRYVDKVMKEYNMLMADS